MKRRRHILIALTLICALYLPAFAGPITGPGYIIFGPSVGGADGRSSASNSFSLKSVRIGGLFGGSAGSRSFIIRSYPVAYRDYMPSESIYIYPIGWMVTEIKPGGTKITAGPERIIVKNDGAVPLTYSVRVIDASGTWSAAEAPGANDTNAYIISAIFTDTSIASVEDTYFNQEPGRRDDIVPDQGDAACTTTRFSCRQSDKGGMAVGPGQERALWLRFTAPKIDTTGKEEHELWLIIEAKRI